MRNTFRLRMPEETISGTSLKHHVVAGVGDDLVEAVVHHRGYARRRYSVSAARDRGP